jgi:hypothetical protein
MVTCQGQDFPLCTIVPFAYFLAWSSPVAMLAITATRWTVNWTPPPLVLILQCVSRSHSGVHAKNITWHHCCFVKCNCTSYIIHLVFKYIISRLTKNLHISVTQRLLTMEETGYRLMHKLYSSLHHHVWNNFESSNEFCQYYYQCF